MSTQQGPAPAGDGASVSEPAPARPGAKAARTGVTGLGISESGGTKTFRLPGPIALWWVWVVFAAANLADLAAQGRDWVSVQITVGLLAITAIVYICTLRPRVITDADGLTMRNPLREHRVPWGRVEEIFLSESVQVKCTAEGGGKGKLLHAWALYAPRRSGVRADIRGRRTETRQASRPGGYGQLPPEAGDISKRTVTELIAREIDAMAKKAQDGGVPGGRIEVTWAWLPLAAVLAGWLALTLVITLR